MKWAFSGETDALYMIVCSTGSTFLNVRNDVLRQGRRKTMKDLINAAQDDVGELSSDSTVVV